MIDKKIDIDTDFKEKLAKIANKKSRLRTNNDIYERFISRVQSAEDDDRENGESDDIKQWEDAKKPSAYEPLSANELELFSGQDTDREVWLEATDAPFDFLDQDLSIKENISDIDSHLEDDKLTDELFDIESDNSHVDHTDKAELSDTDETVQISANDSFVPQDSAMQPVVKEIAPSKLKDKLASSKKPLIIGIILGSLLIAIIVATLILTGVLSTSTKTEVLNSTDTSPNSNAATQVTTDGTPVVSPTQTTGIEDNQLSANAGMIEKPTVELQQDGLVNTEQSVATNGVEAAEVSQPPANDLEAEAAITYEDFRQESQNTLYRETDD